MPKAYSIDMVDEATLARMRDEEDDDQEFDPFLVAPEAFQYLPPPDFGGPAGPVHARVRAETGGASPQPAAKPGFIARLLGGKASPADDYRAKAREYEARLADHAARVAEALAQIGAARAYCRYDGGNDEGFAWFDHCEMKDGTKLDEAAAFSRLQLRGSLTDLGFAPNVVRGEGSLEDVASYWAVKLLGEGYGTGEYVMYGAFSVDLNSGLISDDPKPAPIVQNISFKD